MPRLFVIVPSLDETGPIRGAAALANCAVQRVPVSLVVLKRVHPVAFPVDPAVRVESLQAVTSWRAKLAHLRALVAAEGPGGAACLSLCMSADLLTLWLRGEARIVSSVRSNLVANYRYDRGPVGVLQAIGHYLALRRFDLVLSMSEAMSAQLRGFGLTRLARIDNFVDEAALEGFRAPPSPASDSHRLVYVGSLTRRKRVELLVEALPALAAAGLRVSLDIVGDGACRRELERRVEALGLAEAVTFHGHLPVPYGVIRTADAMVLPSMSEGKSRAVLEALYLGVPCVLRDVEAAGEIIAAGANGELFRDDRDLPAAIARLLALVAAGRFRGRGNLLPPGARQAANVERIIELVFADGIGAGAAAPETAAGSRR